MTQAANTTHTTHPPKWITITSIVLGALFTYFAFLSLALSLVELWYQTGLFHYENLRVLLPVAVTAAGGLWWIARRYSTPTVQAGALAGAGIMTGLNFVYAWVEFSDESATLTKFALTIPVGLIIFFAVGRLTANPSKEPGESSGFVVLWRSLPGVSRRTGGDVPSPSRRISDPATDSDGSTTERPSSLYRRPSISRYWLIVGGAFAVCIPIAVVNTELGLGLLSAFLTAYALSHRIERESREGDDGG